MRCLYVDMDGTLLGPGGALVLDGEKAFTLLGVRAVEACSRVGAEVVLMSGRRRVQVAEDARLLAQTSYIFELGACVVLDGEEQWLTGDWRPGERTIHEQIADTGIPQLLLERYDGRLEYHAPWHHGREVSHLMRGLVDERELNDLFAHHGHPDLRIVDNGVVHRRSPALEALPAVHAYHLLPAGASKANAVAAHMQARGYAPQECLAVGDSREDLDVARHVGSFWLVANAVTKDPTIRDDAARYGNVRIAEEPHGPGVYEAVITTLAEGRR
jgi:hydroxymethylpyrimidine pyrophosphatase-like HAD family hydrolase